ncbi:MAG: hypothetical protein HC924_11690 [Synechococcaceae cyanobacterium SM2_3_2]|nr:hypothetical protein [Synechococcaceae cyanobacterium SM2_3_2]
MLHLSHSFNTLLVVTGIPVIGTALMVLGVAAMPRVSVEQAAQIARFTYTEGVIEEIGLDDDEDRWEVDFTNNTDMEIDASTGQVIEVDYKNERPDPRLDPTISLEEAVAIARPLGSSSHIKDIDLDIEDGLLVWEVEFANDVAVEIDATTGTVLEVEED